MCERCEAIERELATFRRLRATIEDKFTLVLMDEAVNDLLSERLALHSQDELGGNFGAASI